MNMHDSQAHGARPNASKGLAPMGLQRNSYPEVRLDCIDPRACSTTTKSIEILGDLSEKIGEGTYREVYRYNEFAVKKTKTRVAKKILFIKIPFPTSLYTFITYGLLDLSEYEYRQFQSIISKMPPELHACFARVYEPLSRNDSCYSINQLVIDDDGQPSKTLVEYEKISDKNFWSVFDDLENSFLENRIYYMSIGAFNILVQKQADGRILPVLVDYKRIGIRTFAHQLQLYIPYFMRLKMRRRFQGVRETYRDYCATAADKGTHT